MNLREIKRDEPETMESLRWSRFAPVESRAESATNRLGNIGEPIEFFNEHVEAEVEAEGELVSTDAVGQP